jgi:hypothetical protein
LQLVAIAEGFGYDRIAMLICFNNGVETDIIGMAYNARSNE